MEQIHFENYNDFVYEINETLDSLQDTLGSISVIAKYEQAKEVIKELVYLGYDIASVNLYNEEYCDEYILDITCDEIWCEKFKRGNEYIYAESYAIYVMDNCSSKVISRCHSDLVYEVSISDCKEESSDISNDTNTSEATYISRSKDGVPHGFVKTWTTTENGITCYSSYSHYTDNIDMLREIAEKFSVIL